MANGKKEKICLPQAQVHVSDTPCLILLNIVLNIVTKTRFLYFLLKILCFDIFSSLWKRRFTLFHDSGYKH